MDFKKLLVAAVLVAGAVYFYRHRASAPSPPSSTPQPSSGAAWDGFNAVRLAEQANERVREAGLLLARPPVDAQAFGSAESAAQSAISSAESACGGAASEKERQAADAVRAALSEMRTYLSELAGAARGSGGATAAVQRQEEIEARLERARTLLRS